jgi:hypothetical protein
MVENYVKNPVYMCYNCAKWHIGSGFHVPSETVMPAREEGFLPLNTDSGRRKRQYHFHAGHEECPLPRYFFAVGVPKGTIYVF